MKTIKADHLRVKVKASAGRHAIECIHGVFHIETKSPAKEGKANESVLALLSAYLSVPTEKLKIIRGLDKPSKIVLHILS